MAEPQVRGGSTPFQVGPSGSWAKQRAAGRTSRHNIEPGTRVRLNDKCPWPARRGAAGVVVAPRGGVYPQHVEGQVIVLLDNDPLTHRPDRWWTCQLPAYDVDPIHNQTTDPTTEGQPCS